MDKADRYNAGKRRWSLVHYKSLEPLVEALEYGANKYAPDNWKKGLDKKEILDSAMRHISAVIDGENLDPESKVKHIGHAMANLMFYEYFDNLDNEIEKLRVEVEEKEVKPPGINSQVFHLKFDKDQFLKSVILGLPEVYYIKGEKI